MQSRPRVSESDPQFLAHTAVSSSSSKQFVIPILDNATSVPDSFRSITARQDIEMKPMAGRHHPHQANHFPDDTQNRRRQNSVLKVAGNGLDLRLPEVQTRGRASASGSASGSEESKDEADIRDDEDETGSLLGADPVFSDEYNRAGDGVLSRGHGRAGRITDDERREADETVVRRLLLNAVFIILWYFFSLSISLYNKWMFGGKRLNFAFPLFITSFHMLVQFGLAALVLYMIPSLRPSRHRRGMSDRGRSRHVSESAQSAPSMSRAFFLTRVVPCGAATGLDIGLGNTSLMFITLTFYTMCKSSSLAFVLLFAFVFRLEKPTWRLVAIIATLMIGVVMMVAGEVEFNVVGFTLIISAAFFSGFRWGLTQTMLLRHPATSNPFSSIFYIAPVMFLVLFLIALPIEGPIALVRGLAGLWALWGVYTPIVLLSPGCLAFLMTACEFALLQRTSVVTLSIAGIFKEVVMITAASVVFGDRLTPINAIGLIITMAAISVYNWIKISKMRRDAQHDVLRRNQSPFPLSTATASPSGTNASSPNACPPPFFSTPPSDSPISSPRDDGGGSDAALRPLRSNDQFDRSPDTRFGVGKGAAKL